MNTDVTKLIKIARRIIDKITGPYIGNVILESANTRGVLPKDERVNYTPPEVVRKTPSAAFVWVLIECAQDRPRWAIYGIPALLLLAGYQLFSLVMRLIS